MGFYDGWLRFIRSEQQSLPLPGKNDQAVGKPSSQQFSSGISLLAVVSGSGTELLKALLMERFLFTGTVKHYADDVRLFVNEKKKQRSAEYSSPRCGAAFRYSLYTFKD